MYDNFVYGGIDMFIINFFKKIFYGYRYDSKSYIKYLRNKGALIGDGVNIFDPSRTIIDDTRAYMIKIGNNVKIASGVTILTHDYGWSVCKGLYGEVLGSCDEVVIGNNVFVGMKATILKGVHIADNCIIGANSVVTHDVETGWVVAGNPARPLMRVDEYLLKRRKKQLFEAKKLYNCYIERFNKEPSEDEFDEFFWLFKRRDEKFSDKQEFKMKLLDNYESSMERYLEIQPMFDGFNEFIKYLRDGK